MAIAVLSWIIAIPLLGAVTGLRSMTPMAVLCWFAYLGHLPLDGTWAAWTAKLPVAIVFTVLAAAEYIGDKLPKMPNRTSPVTLITRLILGGLIGAIVAAGLDGPGFEGGILGVAGALIGTFGGFLIRREIVLQRGSKDWPVALLEDAIALGCAVLAMGVVTG
ncbi:MAG: hypothetical protein JWQ42_596 [Edaphobacter sp.]|jgi:uncharacterized membrane protein|nr:hypothetical protein [Edaphobacter sp.]